MNYSTKKIIQIEEVKYPTLRAILEVLQVDEGIPGLSWENKDKSGEIGIFVCSTLITKLNALWSDLSDEFSNNEDLEMIGEFSRSDVDVLEDFIVLLTGLETNQTIFYGTYI